MAPNKKMTMKKRQELTVVEAAERIAELGEELEEEYRNTRQLKATLVEVILIAEAWRCLEPKSQNARIKLLKVRVENKAGRPAGVENLLLRASLEGSLKNRTKIKNWARACVNVAAHLKAKGTKIDKSSVKEVFVRVTIENARMNRFS